MGVRAGLEYPEGDPGGLTAAAGRLSSLASQVAGQAGAIARAGQVSGWEGHRYALFQAATRGIAPGLERGATALRRAARLVEDLADQFQRAQRQIRDWSEEITAAEKVVQEAESAVRAERFKSETFGDPLAPFPGPDPLQEAQARYDRAARHLAELRSRYEPQARRLCEELEQEDRSVSTALRAAAASAPAGGTGAPGAPNVPADVLLFAPVWLFAPGESYLPTDPRRNALDLRNVDSAQDWERYLRGEGAGAPIFYRVRSLGDEKVIEYWFYRRWNDFRDLHIPEWTEHPDDSEAVAVRIRNGRPVDVAYSQHSGGCSLAYDKVPLRGGHPVSYPGDGSASNSPYQGHDDRIPGPYDDLHGPAPDERTPRENVVHGEDNLVDYDGPESGRPWQILDPEGNKVPGNEKDNAKKFLPGSSVWSEECEKLPARE
jgi:uncharacterized protein YukE